MDLWELMKSITGARHPVLTQSPCFQWSGHHGKAFEIEVYNWMQASTNGKNWLSLGSFWIPALVLENRSTVVHDVAWPHRIIAVKRNWKSVFSRSAAFWMIRLALKPKFGGIALGNLKKKRPIIDWIFHGGFKVAQRIVWIFHAWYYVLARYGSDLSRPFCSLSFKIQQHDDRPTKKNYAIFCSTWQLKHRE